MSIYRDIAGILVHNANKILELKNKVTIALPGGRSMPKICEELKKQAIDWDNIHFFLTDERIIPENETLSNYTLLKSLLPDFKIFKFNIANIQTGLQEYNQKLSENGGFIDIALFSSGEDGHIASLFPEHPSLQDESEGYIEIKAAPKAPAHRISMSKNLIKKSAYALLYFLGKEKEEAMKLFESKTHFEQNCPAKIIQEVKLFDVVKDFDI